VTIDTDSRTQVGWFTADNANNNDTAMKEFGSILNPGGDHWDPVQRRVRYSILTHVCKCMITDYVHSCMEHSLHLAAGHFIAEIGPTAAAEVIKKVRGATVEDDNEGEDTEFDIADTLGKALALVQQVSLSSSVFSVLTDNGRQDTKISSSPCVLQTDVSRGRRARARTRPIRPDPMGILVHVSGPDAQAPEGRQ
jgi:hypothetical protein